MKKFLFLATSLLFVSCSSFKIDRSTYKAKSQNERIRYIVLHYTAINDEKSIRALTNNEVSSHYLITTKKKDPIYSLVPDEKRAWHAGNSYFDGRTNLNDTAIGIEIVNMGYRKKHNGKVEFIPSDWYLPFDQTQIDKVAFLVKQLSEKYNISPKNILGHSDIAPGRKQDPGPKFPWKQLYDTHGIGAWYNHADYVYFLNPALYNQYSVPQLKAELKKYGYKIEDESPEWDRGTQNVIYAFQSHFRPGLTNGVMDLETFAILKALNKKYK